MERKLLFEIKNRTNLALILLISISVFFIIKSLANIIFANQADEGYYLYYAKSISDNGITHFPDLFKFYLGDKANWVYPSPLRIGFITISSLFAKIFGNSFISLSLLSLFSFVVFLIVNFHFIKKYFSEKIALLSVALLAFSPINMAMARRALMDSTANLFICLAVWLFLDSLKEDRLLKKILFVLAYSAAILIRENSALLSIFFLAYILIRSSIIRENKARIADILTTTFIPFIIVGIAYIVAAGGVSQVANTARIILNSPKTNLYAINFGSGPWFRYLIDFMLLSPWVLILFIGFIFYYIMKDKGQEEVNYLLFFFLSSIIIFSFFTKNIRYLIFLDMPLRLSAILMLNELTKRIFKDRFFVALFIIVLLVSLSDYRSFDYLFVKNGIYDPVSCWLLQASRIIPWK